jgi:multidrug efflux pump
MKLVQVQDQPKAVANSVNEFVKVLIEAVAIVLAVSFLSLGLHKRPGQHPLWRRWTSTSGPAWWWASPSRWCWPSPSWPCYWGIGLHKISLGSLIIALGLLVDDAIIAVEMMVRKMEEGYDKVRAATFAYELTAMPMLTGTLITAAGFLPIGIARSMTGEYTFAIFAVTVIALVLSWIVSVYFVPYLGTLLLKTPPHVVAASEAGQAHTTNRTRCSTAPSTTRFRRLVNGACAPLDHHRRHRGAVRLGIAGMGKVQQQFFPDSSRPEILVDLWYARGHGVRGQRRSGQAGRSAPDGEPGVATVSQWVGSGVPRFYLPLDQIFPAEQRLAVHRAAQGPEGARGAAREAAGPAGTGVPGGARPRQAAAQRPAGAVSGAVPRGRPRPAGAARAADEVKAMMRARARTRAA